MSLYKRGDVYWSYVIIDGIRHQQSTGTSKRRQAEAIEQRFRDELNLKRHQLPQYNPDMTFNELAARFLATGGPRPYHHDRLKFLLPYFGETAIGQITKGQAHQYRLERHRRRKLCDATINRDLESLRHILYWAVDEGLLAANPLARLQLIRERRRRRPVLSIEEEPLLLDAAAPHLKDIIIAALDTGMRRGEILAQRWQDVDFARKLLFVTHSKTPEGEAREIPLTSRLFALLWEKREDEGLIFTFDGKPIQRIKTAWAAAIRRSDIRPYRFHDLRHTFNTRMMEAGVQQEVRKCLMGHSSGEDINSRYTHVELPLMRQAIRKLEEWLAEQLREANAQKERKEK